MSIYDLQRAARADDRIAVCPECKTEVEVTKRGRFFAHAGTPTPLGAGRYAVLTCDGSGRRANAEGSR